MNLKVLNLTAFKGKGEPNHNHVDLTKQSTQHQEIGMTMRPFRLRKDKTRDALVRDRGIGHFVRDETFWIRDDVAAPETFPRCTVKTIKRN